MSKQEFVRLEVLLGVQSGRLRVADACALIGLRRRQVFRLLRGVKQNGAASLLSKHRGKPSNHRLPAEVRTLALVRDRYPDFRGRRKRVRNWRAAWVDAPLRRNRNRSGKHHSPGLGINGTPREPDRRSAKRGYSGPSLIRKSHAISTAATPNSTSPGSRIHCQTSVVS
jgi:hypothetical protein